MSDSDIVISMRNLVKRFGGQTVLDGVNLDVRRGETVVIMGGSGCGKSTTLRHMVGSLIPNEGSVEVLGKDLATLDEDELNEVRKKFGILFQSGALFNSMTVADNVALILEEHTDLDASIIDMMVKIKLELVDLREAADKYPAQISGGMKKRAGLARALALDPEILFYDEPSAGLDPVTSAAIDQLIIDLTKRLGVASVVVTHEMDSAFTIADRMVMLHKGRVLMNEPRAEFERLRDWPESDLGSLDESQQLIRQFLRGEPDGPMTAHDTEGQGGYAADLLGVDNSKLTGGRSVQSTRGAGGFWRALLGRRGEESETT
ncbi:MAG: ABC transporter ATP-binding protein [Phycisphaerales bacterium]|nr:ABC transporter ATP-binding protein [Phycisphaerales bacterium]